MNISQIIQTLEVYAPLLYAENYDNAGLIIGDANWQCTGVICTLDATENVVEEAVQNNCNLIVAHHPIIFGGLKKITGKNYVEKTIITAIKNDIAIYAIHTNIDNVYNGVSKRMAEKLGLQNCKVLAPKTGLLKKLFTYIPVDDAEKVRAAIFKTGGGEIGNYTEVSFNSEGIGTYTPGKGAKPYIGEWGKRAETPEIKLEIIFPAPLQQQIIDAFLAAHPYEEVAYDIISLDNTFQNIGSGIIGELPEAISETDFLKVIKNSFHLQVIKHTGLLNKHVKKVALCGGAGGFLLPYAISGGAEFFITADIKYHEFFDANGRIVFADIGHWESEQFTIDLLFDILQSKFPTFAVLKTKVITNPVSYFL